MTTSRQQVSEDEDMRKEYDFTHAVRGKYAKRFPRDAVMVTLAPGRS